MPQRRQGDLAGSALAVCSWSLRPDSVADLGAKVRACALDAVQLDLRPFGEPSALPGWRAEDVRDRLGAAGVRIVSGMIGFATEDYASPATIHATGGVRPDGAWPGNRERVRRMAIAAQTLGVSLVTMHAGCLPVRAAPGGDRGDHGARGVMLDRLREAARALAGAGARLALETGQERAEDLRDALDDLQDQDVGVNFDPANMILYGAGEPVEAFRALAPWVRQMHLKDALPPRAKDEWGTEVPIGRGAVDWDGLLRASSERTPRVGMVIEREAGEMRVEDVRSGAEFVRAALARLGVAS